MTNEQIAKIRNLGFMLFEEKERGKMYIFNDNVPDVNVLEALLRVLTFGDEIEYWDAYRKSPTDPGGYVTALRRDEEHISYMEGNHGWSSRWDTVTLKEMAEHIRKNWDKDMDGGEYKNKIVIKHNKYISPGIIARDHK